MKRNFKFIVLTLVVGLMLFTGGCALTSSMSAEDRAKWDQMIQTNEAVVENANATIETLEDHEKEIDVLISVLPDGDTRQKLEDVKAEVIEKIREHKHERDAATQAVTDANQAIKDAETNGEAIGEVITGIGTTGTAIAPVTGPAAPWVLLGGTILTMIGGIFKAFTSGKKSGVKKVANAIEQVKKDNAVDFSDYPTLMDWRAKFTDSELRAIAEARGKK